MSMRKLLLRAGLAAALMAGAATLSVGCDDKAATAILVAISSEVAVPKEIDAISLSIERGGEVRFRQRYEVDVATGRVRLPGSISITPSDEDHVDERVRVELLAEVRGIQVVLRTATMGFQAERQKLLRIVLRYSCYDVAEVCESGQTCIGGTCQSDFVDVTKLPDAPASEEIFVSHDSGGLCFDARDTACAANREVVSDLAAFVAKGCKFSPTLPTGASASNLNVFARWVMNADQAHPTVIEAESAEGWSTPEGAASGTFQLAPGLCSAVADGRITRVSYNFACPSKHEEMPVCLPGVDDVIDGKFSDSPCHACVYTPSQCAAELGAAKSSAAGGAILSCALTCGYDGHYDTLDECSAVHDCFYGCFAPYLDCLQSDCAPYAELAAWSECLSLLEDPSMRCASECAAENSGACK